MEDFQSAYGERDKDTRVLHDSDRKIAAMHLGGVTVECLLKALLLSSLPEEKRMWSKDYSSGHTVANPGHSFQKALRQNRSLDDLVSRNRQVQQWIKTIEKPNQMSFIDMRYSSSLPHEQDYKDWWFAYKSLVAWLLRQLWK